MDETHENSTQGAIETDDNNNNIDNSLSDLDTNQFILYDNIQSKLNLADFRKQNLIRRYDRTI
jgi:hypothetical protein